METPKFNKTNAKIVTLAHGGGGKAMRDLIQDVFIRDFFTEDTGEMEDQARLEIPSELSGSRLAFTSDGFVVDPLFFNGGDIGKLAVYGTVNDLAVGGAIPKWLSASFIIEEGLEVETLRKIATSMRDAAIKAGVKIVTGDTKVVARGAADKVFITTSGVGLIPNGVNLAASTVQEGDVAIVNGFLGHHGAAILQARGDLMLEGEIKSDCAPLGELMAVAMGAGVVHCARDLTRGGLASALNEIADACGHVIELEEEKMPLKPEIRGFCEILGFDPLYLANEGSLVLFVPAVDAENVLKAMREHEFGKDACIIGRVKTGNRPQVEMKTTFGGTRIVDMLVGEQLPRIC
ncbi:hydrogenase expression/formation protein HypE [Pseudaquidulcibacter saccharophilus]|uniref:hydrogenase expression/formation protein HypE n=1 Tax=Pseudaquidulcibacter saccharophilus TaxID=2831900 RepID=UPI001EFF3A4C|nr:hydrogenase expression/formation protein HypE [Pseudaquidulcibacter saccharophilus]